MLNRDHDYHVCPKRRRAGRAAAKTKKLQAKNEIQAIEDQIFLRELAIRRALLRQHASTIAEQMQVGYNLVLSTLSSAKYAETLQALQRESVEKHEQVFRLVQEKLQNAEVLAADRVNDILERKVTDKSMPTQAMLARDVLNMRGYAKPKEQKTEIAVSLTEDTVDLLRIAMNEMKKVDSIDLDAEGVQWAFEKPKPRLEHHAFTPASVELERPAEEEPVPVGTIGDER